MVKSENISRIRSLIRPSRARPTVRSAPRLPELAIKKAISVGRAYDEYCRRVESGETIDTDAFCSIHADFRSALFRRIELHKYLDDNPDALQYLEPIPWPKVGDSFGDSTLIEELGYGGAGRVFLAKEKELSRLIVLKLVVGDNGEAERLCRLNHPSIVPIYYVRQDPDSGLTAICMPFESRYTLNDFRDAAFRKQSPDRFREVLQQLFPGESSANDGDKTDLKEMSFVDGVLSIGHRLCQALDHSHRAGIYHLDLKPSNVLVKSDGMPLLIDFNLAVRAGQKAELFGGTKPYMSPEQIRRLIFPFSPDTPELDGKSDVYSLGVMLCQILTGEHPFGAVSWEGTEEQLLLRQQEWSPDELHRLANIDRKVVRLLADCLIVAPERRIGSAELAKRLERILRIRGSRFGSRRRFLAVSAVLAGIAVGGFSLQKPDATRLYLNGVARLERGQYDEAIRLLSRSIELNPDNAAAWSNRALARLRQGEEACDQDALRDYLEARQRSRAPEIIGCVGYCEARLGQHANALSYLEDAIEKGFQSAELYNALGYCQMQLTYYDQAATSFTKAVIEKPRLQAALYHRAVNELRRSGYRDGQLGPFAVDDIEGALKLGEADAKMLFSAACIWALAPGSAKRTAKILEYADGCLALGTEPRKFTSVPQFQEFQNNPKFRDILERQRTPRRVSIPSQLPHPLGTGVHQVSNERGGNAG